MTVCNIYIYALKTCFFHEGGGGVNNTNNDLFGLTLQGNATVVYKSSHKYTVLTSQNFLIIGVQDFMRILSNCRSSSSSSVKLPTASWHSFVNSFMCSCRQYISWGRQYQHIPCYIMSSSISYYITKQPESSVLCGNTLSLKWVTEQSDIAIMKTRQRLFCFYILLFNGFISFQAQIWYKYVLITYFIF